jgi:hypothetical protein
VSAVQIQRHLGIRSYQTAWHMVHRLREAMDMRDASPMKGVVEIDETFIDGRTKGRFKRASEPKAPKDVVVVKGSKTTDGFATSMFGMPRQVRLARSGIAILRQPLAGSMQIMLRSTARYERDVERKTQSITPSNGLFPVHVTHPHQHSRVFVLSSRARSHW